MYREYKGASPGPAEADRPCRCRAISSRLPLHPWWATVRDSSLGRAEPNGESAALHGTAGNAAVAEGIQRQDVPGANESARKNALDPTGHGEWSTPTPNGRTRR
ncbi:hypothetical protein [Streptomyces sp. NPDC007172]|uniref:hypothetical protein n=1 Tax=Streptomyces sp. NPDC007172 TaxID=3364776 RepID=UPI003689B851